ncbi:EAL domain-containing protein [Roseibium aestuarii]|uniref:EAL domain-containing protein n=1 Tax=Roseibium aestuarii TaxID=2600299 RepID=A0ABW4JT72_9HYPH|nr:EAL domain-containing protein [Roseibium aestuarii]
MGRTATIFIVICMAVISASAATILVFQLGRPVGEAVSLSLAIMCTMILLHVLFTRSRDRGALGEVVDRLEDRIAEIDEDVGNLEGRLTGMESTIPHRTRQEIDPLFAEVEVLGTLVKQMAEAMSDLETRVEEQGQLPHAPQPALPSYGARPSMTYDQGMAPQLSAPQSAMAPGSHVHADARPVPPSMPQAMAPHDGQRETVRQEWSSGYVQPEPPRSAPAPQPAPRDDYVDPYAAPRSRGQQTVYPPQGQPGGGNGGGDPAMREIINAALNNNRVELHLQPIVTLPQRQVKYYEAYTRLRDSEGQLIEAAVFMPEAIRSGRIARIDNLLLFRSIQVIRRLTSRSRNTALFCNLSSLSLIDETFFPGFLEFVKANRTFSEVLVFEFSQQDVNQMGVMELESLSALSELGFRFSVDGITDMKMDFKALAQRGFKYAKLHCDYLIGRRQANHGHIHPSDFGDLLHRYGITLIPNHVETESQVLELLDLDVGLAQGNLFSPARPVRAEVLQGAPAPAPAAPGRGPSRQSDRAQAAQ